MFIFNTVELAKLHLKKKIPCHLEMHVTVSLQHPETWLRSSSQGIIVFILVLRQTVAQEARCWGAATYLDKHRGSEAGSLSEFSVLPQESMKHASL